MVQSLEFSEPSGGGPAVHHSEAAAGNAQVTGDVALQLSAALAGDLDIDRILLKAAAGAGKSHLLKQLVQAACADSNCSRVGLVAFTNLQILPLARDLGKLLGRRRVCLFSADAWLERAGEVVGDHATIVAKAKDIPAEASVIIATTRKLSGRWGGKAILENFGPARNGDQLFDVLFVDEAWQLPNHLFDGVRKTAPLVVGVGDVGQLPPLEIGSNPWRGDPGHNPYRAWPTAYDGDARTISAELPTVWRPTAAQLPLWRAFYPEWEQLHCVAAPGDRDIVLGSLHGVAQQIWAQVATGTPVLLEVDDLPEAEAADVDLPLMNFIEALLDELLTAGFSLTSAVYDETGAATGQTTSVSLGDASDDRLITLLATRNQAVDDATGAVERLRRAHHLADSDLGASTVDAWQGQTNGITVAVHPLTGATKLDEFNSAFGRLAVTCSRATHGLLVVSRPGLDTLLNRAAVRPGNPFGEPGNRRLPRQTHQRILANFVRATVSADTLALSTTEA